MAAWTDAFLDFLLSTGALGFGEFTTKSGRKSPYFINTGKFHTGDRLGRLGSFYAQCLKTHFPDATVVFGPAYKGIPLCTATAEAMARDQKADIGWAFNRKEVKDHGDGGLVVGKALTPEDKVVLVDDVITAGLSIDESLEFLKRQGNPKVLGVIVAVNRQEKNPLGEDAIGSIRARHGIAVEALLTLADLLEAARRRTLVAPEMIEKIEDYRKAWGI